MCDYQSHTGLYHYYKQEDETAHHIDGREMQWTLWKEVNRDNLENKAKITTSDEYNANLKQHKSHESTTSYMNIGN